MNKIHQSADLGSSPSFDREFIELSKLGAGGMGAVYLVQHRGTGQRFAAKVVSDGSQSDAASQLSLARELQTLVDLPDHPHLAAFRFFRTFDSRFIAFLEFVEGGSLGDSIRQNKLTDPAAILDMAIQIAWGLHVVHRLGFVHQDVKPENILLTPGGLTKISDFGIAQALARANERVVSRGDSRQFRSPEQAHRLPVGYPTDIWSWGLTLLAMFQHGATWIAGEIAPEILAHYRETQTARADWPVMPTGCLCILEKCFERDSNRRWSSMVEIVLRLKKVYRETTGKDYYRELEAAPSRRLCSSPHDRTTVGGFHWDSPQRWMERARRAAEPMSSDRPPSVTPTYSRKSSAIADVVAFLEAREVFEQMLRAGREELQSDYARLCLDAAQTHRSVDDLPGAKCLVDRALAVLRPRQVMNGESLSEYLQACISQATICQELGDTATAMTVYDDLIASYRDGESGDLSETLAIAHMNRANMKATSGRHRLAIADYVDAVRIYEQLIRGGQEELSGDLARALLNLANALASDGSQSEALKLYEQAIAIYRQPTSWKTLRETAVELGTTFVREFNAPGAVLLDVRRYELGLAYLNQAATYLAIGQFERALGASRFALEILDALVCGEDRWELAPDLARAYVTAATANSHAGLLAEALRQHDQAVAMLTDLVERRSRWELAHELALAHFHRASTLYLLGRYADARAAFARAVDLSRTLLELRGHSEAERVLANSLKSLAATERALGNPDSAFTLYDEAIVIYERLMPRVKRYDILLEASTAYQNKANLMLVQNEAAAAMLFFDKCLAIREYLFHDEGRVELAPRLAIAYINKSAALEALGAMPQALAACERAVTVLELLGNNFTAQSEVTIALAHARLNRCLIQFAMGQCEQARLDATGPLAVVQGEFDRTGRADLQRLIRHSLACLFAD